MIHEKVFEVVCILYFLGCICRSCRHTDAPGNPLDWAAIIMLAHTKDVLAFMASVLSYGLLSSKRHTSLLLLPFTLHTPPMSAAISKAHIPLCCCRQKAHIPYAAVATQDVYAPLPIPLSSGISCIVQACPTSVFSAFLLIFNTACPATKPCWLVTISVTSLSTASFGCCIYTHSSGNPVGFQKVRVSGRGL